MIKRAQRAEHLKELGILDASMNSLSSGTSSGALYYGSGLSKGGGAALPMQMHTGTGSLPSREEDDDVRLLLSFVMLLLFKLSTFPPIIFTHT